MIFQNTKSCLKFYRFFLIENENLKLKRLIIWRAALEVKTALRAANPHPLLGSHLRTRDTNKLVSENLLTVLFSFMLNTMGQDCKDENSVNNCLTRGKKNSAMILAKVKEKIYTFKRHHFPTDYLLAFPEWVGLAI